MNPDQIDWASLERMRAAFLESTAGRADYWKRENDLASYDATFAQRIGWKWDFVLNELKSRGWNPPAGELLDWGCGSGVAGRAVLDVYGIERLANLHLWDRSTLAMQFAARRAREKYAGLNVLTGSDARTGTVVISHVLTELDAAQTEALADSLAANAACVLWIEPGTYEASLTLIAVRERLRKHFNVVAPCTHQVPCGILAKGNEQHWCHHFAKPPPEVFMDPNWGRFSHLTQIDLRSLPLSYLVLDKRPAPSFPLNATRIIGRPRMYKPYALLLGCDETGVRERKVTKREFPNEYRNAKKGESASLQILPGGDGGVGG